MQIFSHSYKSKQSTLVYFLCHILISSENNYFHIFWGVIMKISKDFFHYKYNFQQVRADFSLQGFYFRPKNIFSFLFRLKYALYKTTKPFSCIFHLLWCCCFYFCYVFLNVSHFFGFVFMYIVYHIYLSSYHIVYTPLQLTRKSFKRSLLISACA